MGMAPGASNANLRNIQLQAEEHPLVDDQVFRSVEEYALFLMHMKSYETAAKLCAGKDVLDWGCNVGYGIEKLRRHAATVTGVDLSPRAVAVARQRLGGGVEVQLYGGGRCGFADDSFDVITSFQVLEHVSDYTTYFSEILRVLRPGGTVVLATPNAALRLDPGMTPWNEFHVHEFTPIELRDFLGRWFSDVDVRGLFATGELDAIERVRVERARQDARTDAKDSHAPSGIREFVKRHAPWLVALRRRVVKRPRPTPIQPPLDSTVLNRYSTADLFYRPDNLDLALDLLAECRTGAAS